MIVGKHFGTRAKGFASDASLEFAAKLTTVITVRDMNRPLNRTEFAPTPTVTMEMLQQCSPA